MRECHAWYQKLQAWHSLIAVDWHGAHHGWLLEAHEWQGRALAWHKKQAYVPDPNPPPRGWRLGRPPLFEDLGVWRKALEGWYYTALAWHKAYFRWLGTARDWHGSALAWSETRNYPLIPSPTPGGVSFVEPPAPPEGGSVARG